MLMTQIYELMNSIAGELLGEETVVEENLANVVSLGDTFANVAGFDNYVRTLNDKVGRMVFNDRVYKGRAPSVLMDGWEYGSILEKISPELPDATENESFELTAGASYDPNIFYKPSVTVKCWNERVTFEIPVSITERQVKSSFQSPTQLNAFISMIYNAVKNAMTLRLDALVSRTINNLIAETVYADFGANDQTASSGVKAVNLLYLYNTYINAGTDITTITALADKDFIRFASMTMANYIDRMKVMSTLFNIGGKERFTPDDKLHVVMLSEFKNAANVYLQSDTFNEQYTALPTAETVPFWQGSGVNYGFASTSKVDVITSASHDITINGVLSIIFDRDALGVTCQNPRVTTQYNAKAEFWNEWHKYDAGYFNDTDENMVVFYAA